MITTDELNRRYITTRTFLIECVYVCVCVKCVKMDRPCSSYAKSSMRKIVLELNPIIAMCIECDRDMIVNVKLVYFACFFALIYRIATFLLKQFVYNKRNRCEFEEIIILS